MHFLNFALELKAGTNQFFSTRANGFDTGRLLLCIFPRKDETRIEHIPPERHYEIVMHIQWVIGNDIDVQQKGIIFMVWGRIFRNLCGIVGHDNNNSGSSTNNKAITPTIRGYNSSTNPWPQKGSIGCTKLGPTSRIH